METEVCGVRGRTMANAMTTSVARQIESLFASGSVAGLSDRQLIDWFVAGRDSRAAEDAFAAIVARHGPMVLGVCRQLLGDPHHADDAFQAAFLVLARRARSLRDPDLLGQWLYGVALRTARKARGRLARIRRNEGNPAVSGPESVATSAADRSLLERERAEALHAEIESLPASARLPVVLCYFEGLSLSEAARRLRCPAGTVHSRLARAKEKLRRGLTRRGVVLSTTAMAAMLAPRPASASVSSLLCDSTTRAAIAFAARHAAGGVLSATAAALAQEVLLAMLIHKVKAAALSVLLITSLAGGAGYYAINVLAHTRAGRTPREPMANAAWPEPRPGDATLSLDLPKPGRMFVVGRVVDPDGKPVPGAVVEVFTRYRTPKGAGDEAKHGDTLLGQGRSDGEGRYRLDAIRTASTLVYVVHALAAAPGYGLGWAELNPDAEQPAAEIKLLPEQIFHLRLVDVTGAPATGVEVRVQGFGRRTDNGLFDGISFWFDSPEGISTWPRPVTTDDQGRITLGGIGRGRGVDITLGVRDPRYAWQNLRVDSAQPADKEISLALEPAKVIAGRVFAADTGQPVPNAVISIGAGGGRFGGLSMTRFRADPQGRFTANPSPGEYFRVSVYAPEGQPYLVPQVEFPWTKGAVKKDVEIRLPRGVLIRGLVVEAGTNHPLVGSTIYFIPVGGSNDVLSGSQVSVASREDGSFQLAVPPGKGHLLVFGPTGDYVLREVGRDILEYDRPGGWRYRVHAVIPYEVQAGDPPREVTAGLRPGATIKGRVEGPDGQTVTDASILTTLVVEASHPAWLGRDQVKVRDGRFELHGVDPQESVRISILDAEHEWGATVAVSGKQASEDLTIRLQPCGRAKMRFVGPDGRRVARPSVLFEFVATPGPSIYGRRKPQEQAMLAADADFLANVDRKHYWDDPVPDAEGRYTMVSLIPGALYRIIDFSTANDEKGAQVRKEFTVKPGETVDLGDVLIEKPAG
jgi:RNA polymerase sigma factor (sigma-70 family)